MSTEDKNKKKRSIFNKLPFKITCVTLFIVCICLYLFVDGLVCFLGLSALTLVRDFFGLFATSIFVSLLLSYTDIEERTQNVVAESINKWKKEAKDELENIENNLNTICERYDYLNNIDLFPIEQLSKESVDKLMTNLSKKKLDSIKNMGQKYSEIAKDCLQKFDRLQSGHLYHYFLRTITLEPRSEENIILVNMSLKLCQVLPEVCAQEPKYCYNPRFRCKEDAQTLKIVAELNGQQIEPQYSGKLSPVQFGDYKMMFEYGFISNEKNALSLDICYTYKLLSNNNNFYKAYYLMDPTYEFKFTCEVKGEEMDKWEIKILNYGYGNNKNIDLLTSIESEGNVKTVSSKKETWVSNGITILNVCKSGENN